MDSDCGGVFLKDTDEMIGQCGITMQEYKTAQVPEIGYLLAHKFGIKVMQLKPQQLVGSMGLIR